MARFTMEKAKTTGTPQEMGPLNPYARRLVHLTVAEDPGMSSESIGDAFLKTVIISRAAGKPQGPRPVDRSQLRMFCTDDTIVAIATPPGRGGIGVVRLSGPDAHRDRARLTGRDGARAAARDAARRSQAPRGAADRRGRRHVLPGAAFLHRRRRRRDQRARQPGAAARDRARSDARRRAARRARRVHAPRLSARTHRSGAGRSGRAICRRGHAAAGARGVRSARRNADGAIARRSTRALFDLVARLEASLDFPEEGYHFVDAGDAARATRGDFGAHRRRCWRTRARAG